MGFVWDLLISVTFLLILLVTSLSLWRSFGFVRLRAFWALCCG